MSNPVAQTSERPEPDHFFVGQVAVRLPDGGPRYKETPSDPWAVPVAEPWNAVTASFFVLIVFAWLVRLRGRYRQFPFITACMPILLAGGIGGTLYHAFRTQRAYFLLDVIPISLLGAAGAIYLTIRLSRTLGLAKILFVSIGVVLFYLLLNTVLFQTVRSPIPNLTVNLSYASLALILLLPLAVVLVRTRFRHVGWVAAALASFGHAWFCRLVDNTMYMDLPMGTHWLWHTYGALTTWFLVEYFYRIEGKSLEPGSAN